MNSTSTRCSPKTKSPRSTQPSCKQSFPPIPSSSNRPFRSPFLRVTIANLLPRNRPIEIIGHNKTVRLEWVTHESHTPNTSPLRKQGSWSPPHPESWLDPCPVQSRTAQIRPQTQSSPARMTSRQGAPLKTVRQPKRNPKTRRNLFPNWSFHPINGAREHRSSPVPAPFRPTHIPRRGRFVFS